MKEIDPIKHEMLRRTALDTVKRLRETAERLRKEARVLDAQADRLAGETDDAEHS